MTEPSAIEAILELRHLTKVFDKDLLKKRQTVINDLSCRFLSGKCTGFLGHNGAGKTTTIRTIFGLIRQNKGEVLFKGRPIAAGDKAVLGYMPETNKLPAALTCREILSHQLRVYQPRHVPASSYGNLIDDKLREVGLWEHRGKRVGKLSKGMGRRLAWAQATIHDPELVILDEPFSGMDPLGRRHMIGWIKKLKDKQASIILCTHELWSMYHLCDEFHIVRRGALAFSTLDQAPGQEAAPQGLAQRWFLQVSGVDLPGLTALKAKKGLPEWDDVHQEGFLAKLQLPSYEAAAAWLATCQGAGLVIVKLESSKGLLEDRILEYFDGGNV